MSRVLHMLMRKKPTTVIPTPLDITVDTSIADGEALGVYRLTVDTSGVVVDWGDGSTSTTAAGVNLTHTYATPGVYNIKLTGPSFGVKLGDAGGYPSTGKRLTAVNDWGTVKYKSMSYMFYGNTGAFTFPATAPDLSVCTSMNGAFQGASLFNQDISGWNVGSVTNFNYCFRQCPVFNQPIGSWNTGSATTMQDMFYKASVFNQNIGAWNTGNVTRMDQMFYDAFVFNNGGSSDINNWNTGKVTNTSGMFTRAKVFNQPIGNWDFSKVQQATGMFESAYDFNQPIGTWNTSSLQYAAAMFSGQFGGTMTFNQPLVSTATTWQVGQILNMFAMFNGSAGFDQDLSSWVCTQITAANESSQAGNFSTGANAAWIAARATKFPFLDDGVTRFSS